MWTRICKMYNLAYTRLGMIRVCDIFVGKTQPAAYISQNSSQRPLS